MRGHYPLSLAILFALFWTVPLRAQAQDEHAGHNTASPGDSMQNMPGMEHSSSAQDTGGGSGMHRMTGMLGQYSMTRESSGTAWQPQSTPMEGEHFMKMPWMFMVHGSAYLIYDHQGGDRGSDKTISTNMLMLTAQRTLG